MPVIKTKINGQVVLVIGAITVGVVVLFVGLFMLSTIEPMFEGRLTECTFADTAPSAAVTLNATASSGSASVNMTFASATNVAGFCYLTLNVSNVSAQAGSYVEATNALTLAAISNITVTADWASSGSTTEITHASGNWLANVTAYGDDNVTIPTGGSFLRCCNALVAQEGPAGQSYTAVVTSIAVMFSVFGLVLIVVGLAAAVGSLKSMF